MKSPEEQIASLCNLAGYSSKAEGFIAAKMSLRDVQTALVNARAAAAGPHISSIRPTPPPVALVQPGSGIARLVAAVERNRNEGA